MKIALLCIIVMFKCNKLSSELINDEEDANGLSEKNSEVNNSNNDSNKLATSSKQTYYHPSSISYVGGAGHGGFDSGEEDDDGVVFQFRRSIKSDNTEIEARRRSALDKNFMRFGRSDKNMNFMRFGRPDEDTEEEVEKRNDRNRLRFGKKDDRNVLRFGKRRNENMLRFGRSRDNDRNKVRFGRSDKNFMRFGRDPFNVKRLMSQDRNLLRFGKRNPSLLNDYSDATDYDEPMDMPDNREEFPEKFDRMNNNKMFQMSKRKSQNLMRFGRNNENLLRFGRANGNFMRFGRGGPTVTTNVLCIDEKCLLEAKQNQIHQIIQDKIADLANGDNEEIFKYQKISSTRNDEKTTKDLSDLFGNNVDDEPMLRPESTDYDLKSN